MQDMFILNLRPKIAQRREKQHSIRQERREGFSDDNDAIYAELKHQLGNQTLGDPALPRQMLIDTHVGGLGRLEDSQNRSQEMETSLDLSQTSIDWELTILDSDRSNHGSLDNEGVTCVHVPVTVHRSGQCRISYV